MNRSTGSMLYPAAPLHRARDGPAVRV